VITNLPQTVDTVTGAMDGWCYSIQESATDTTQPRLLLFRNWSIADVDFIGMIATNSMRVSLTVRAVGSGAGCEVVIRNAHRDDMRWAIVPEGHNGPIEWDNMPTAQDGTIRPVPNTILCLCISDGIDARMSVTHHGAEAAQLQMNLGRVAPTPNRVNTQPNPTELESIARGLGMPMYVDPQRYGVSPTQAEAAWAATYQGQRQRLEAQLGERVGEVVRAVEENGELRMQVNMENPTIVDAIRNARDRITGIFAAPENAIRGQTLEYEVTDEFDTFTEDGYPDLCTLADSVAESAAPEPPPVQQERVEVIVEINGQRIPFIAMRGTLDRIRTLTDETHGGVVAGRTQDTNLQFNIAREHFPQLALAFDCNTPYKRSVDLLLSLLDDEQRWQYQNHKMFAVKGQVTELTYRIEYGSAYNIKLIEEDNGNIVAVAKLCALPQNGDTIPVPDTMASQLLQLRGNEAAFLHKANFSLLGGNYQRSPSIRKIAPYLRPSIREYIQNRDHRRPANPFDFGGMVGVDMGQDYYRTPMQRPGRPPIGRASARDMQAGRRGLIISRLDEMRPGNSGVRINLENGDTRPVRVSQVYFSRQLQMERPGDIHNIVAQAIHSEAQHILYPLGDVVNAIVRVIQGYTNHVVIQEPVRPTEPRVFVLGHNDMGELVKFGLRQRGDHWESDTMQTGCTMDRTISYSPDGLVFEMDLTQSRQVRRGDRLNVEVNIEAPPYLRYDWRVGAGIENTRGMFLPD
jgi:hypothetical protein